MAALEKRLDEPGRKLAVLEKKIDKLGEEMAQAKKNSDPALPLAALEPRLKWLEKNLQRLDSAPPVLDPRVVARLDRLEKKLAAPSPELTAAEKKIKHIEEDLAQRKKESAPAAALAALQPRVKKLEKELQSVESKAVATGPELSARLDRLEKRLDGRLDSFEGKIKGMEQGLVRGKKGPDPGVMLALLEPRLRRMENQLKVLGSTSAAAQGRLAERLGTLENKVPTRPSPQIASLNERIEKLQRELDKGKDEEKTAALDLRLRRLEKDLSRTRQSLLRVHGPLPDPELANRVDKLEKQLGSSSSAPGRMEKTVAGIERPGASPGQRPKRDRSRNTPQSPKTGRPDQGRLGQPATRAGKEKGSQAQAYGQQIALWKNDSSQGQARRHPFRPGPAV